MDNRAIRIVTLVLSILPVTIASAIDKEEFNFIFTEGGTYVNKILNYTKTYYGPIGPFTSWIKSRKFCLKYGLEFVHYDTNDEFESFKDLMRNRRLGRVKFKMTSFKIGGYRKANNTWYWVDTRKPITIEMKWAKGEPNYNNNKWNCLLATLEDYKLLFKVIDCYKKGDPFACEKKKKIIETFGRQRNINVVRADISEEYIHANDSVYVPGYS